MQSGPNLQAAPAPDMYQNMTSQYRMSGAMNQPPYNQQQQINNQSTVLISSSSNSLMSATVKPTSQIGAIGTKVNAGNVAPSFYSPRMHRKTFAIILKRNSLFSRSNAVCTTIHGHVRSTAATTTE